MPRLGRGTTSLLRIAFYRGSGEGSFLSSRPRHDEDASCSLLYISSASIHRRMKTAGKFTTTMRRHHRRRYTRRREAAPVPSRPRPRHDIHDVMRPSTGFLAAGISALRRHTAVIRLVPPYFARWPLRAAMLGGRAMMPCLHRFSPRRPGRAPRGAAEIAGCTEVASTSRPADDDLSLLKPRQPRTKCHAIFGDDLRAAPVPRRCRQESDIDYTFLLRADTYRHDDDERIGHARRHAPAYFRRGSRAADFRAETFLDASWPANARYELPRRPRRHANARWPRSRSRARYARAVSARAFRFFSSVEAAHGRSDGLAALDCRHAPPRHRWLPLAGEKMMRVAVVTSSQHFAVGRRRIIALRGGRWPAFSRGSRRDAILRDDSR